VHHAAGAALHCAGARARALSAQRLAHHPPSPLFALCVRAGIKKPAQQRYRNTKGVDPKFLRNQRYVTRGIRKVTDKVAGGAQ
jgi:hypothetical protein